MEIVNDIWSRIAPYLTGAAIGTFIASIVTGVIVALIKGFITKSIARIDVKGQAEEVANKTIDRIKTQTIKQDITPIVKGEILKATELAYTQLLEENKKTREALAKVVEIQKAQAKYFDGSVYVSDEAKEELSKAIADAENFLDTPKPIIEAEIDVVKEETKKEEKTQNKANNEAVVVR